MNRPLTVINSGTAAPEAANLPFERERIASELSALDVGEIRFGRHDRLLYSTDASLYQVEPIGVIIPENVEHVRRKLQYCAKHGVAVLPRGDLSERP